MAGVFQIGQLADRVGVTAKAIRYYEEIGLLPEPERSEGGYRLYGDDAEERLRFVTSARRVGFALGEIKEVLALRDRGEPPCAYVRDVIERKRRELDRHLDELAQLRRELAELGRRARTLPTESSGRYCHILQRNDHSPKQKDERRPGKDGQK